eukprot:scaffold3581_cov252-Pinguiococcus_pyrenoidosus.AAC.12
MRGTMTCHGRKPGSLCAAGRRLCLACVSPAVLPSHGMQPCPLQDLPAQGHASLHHGLRFKDRQLRRTEMRRPSQSENPAEPSSPSEGKPGRRAGSCTSSS